MTRLEITEAQLQRRVTDTLTAMGWTWCHFRPAQTAKGWRTPVEGMAGCPDIIAARRGKVLLAELKSATGKTTSQQDAWLTAAGDHARLWRPSDWNTILAELAS